MCAFAADVGEAGNEMSRELLLQPKTPLLHIGIWGLGGDRCDIQRECRALGVPRALRDTYIGITIWIFLLRALNYWGTAFERAGIRFLPSSVFVEQSVTAAEGSFALAEGIPGETDTRFGVEYLAIDAARRKAMGAAAHK